MDKNVKANWTFNNAFFGVLININVSVFYVCVIGQKILWIVLKPGVLRSKIIFRETKQK
jgi:hypothetical protein